MILQRTASPALVCHTYPVLIIVYNSIPLMATTCGNWPHGCANHQGDFCNDRGQNDLPCTPLRCIHESSVASEEKTHNPFRGCFHAELYYRRPISVQCTMKAFKVLLDRLLQMNYSISGMLNKLQPDTPVAHREPRRTCCVSFEFISWFPQPSLK